MNHSAEGSPTPTDDIPLATSVVTSRHSWWIWLAVNAIVSGFFLSGLLTSASSMKSAWLPGETTHGHYQIELACDACHTPTQDDSQHSTGNVMRDACNDCHSEQLRIANDTHPAKKFNDPTNAVLLETLDAQDCLACHREHVPERTLAMGLTMPLDYCWHCHRDVAESRPSHQGMGFDSCATAGCHNYHDNRALYEKFLSDHFDEPDFKDVMKLPSRNFGERWCFDHPESRPLQQTDADAPKSKMRDLTLIQDWQETLHAMAGVNCNDCHLDQTTADSGWSDSVSMKSCDACHATQTQSFVRGKHGMRLEVGLTAMTPKMARLPMHAGVAHEQLTCNTCHPGHRFDTKFASTQACLNCHNDLHSQAYSESTHAALWNDELAGVGQQGSGVSCATCHLPRLSDREQVWVNHNQNANLRPNETMAREVCLRCHGLEFSLTSLADPLQRTECYSISVPTADSAHSSRHPSVRMAHDWFAEKKARQNSRRNSPRSR